MKKTEAAVALTAIATDAATLSPLGSVVLHLVMPVVVPAMEARRIRKGQRVLEMVVDELARQDDLSPEEAAEALRSALEDADGEAVDRLEEAFQSILESRAADTWPYVARLTALHIRDPGRDRRFFRQCASLLQGLLDGDVDVLKVIFEEARTLIPPNDPTFKLIEIRLELEERKVELVPHKSWTPGQRATSQLHSVPPETLAVLEMMRQQRLASTLGSQRIAFTVSATDCRQLMDVLCV